MEDNSLVPAQVLSNGQVNSKKKQRRPKKKPQKKSETEAAEKPVTTDSKDAKANKRAEPKKKESKPPAVKPDETNQATKAPKKKKNQKKGRRPDWVKHVPKDAVDPITLDPLHKLRYPPFAIVASEPYEPVERWYEDGTEKETEDVNQVREKQILQEQWGSVVCLDEQGQKEPPKKRHFNLFDGRALAYWMVSSNQFIDPLNRRDLVRDELVHLDRYLRQHGFKNLNVTEAYDVKGVSLSTAGAAASTAAGRAAILQEEARNLLNALFGHSTLAPPQASTNRLANQYQAYQSTDRRRTRRSESSQVEDSGIYGDEEGGIVLIDDDLNPGLRGSAPEFVPQSQQASNGNLLYSASHIASRYSHGARIQQDQFPSLGEAAQPASTLPAENETRKKELPKVNTLSKITKTVKKTDPEELQKQFEAREAARRKAMMANLTFGQTNLSTPPGVEATLPGFPVSEQKMPSEGQIERNRRLADALGVKPSTVRNRLDAGWARPTSREIEKDDFGNELNVTTYPDGLIAKAKDRMALLLKIEKKWLQFLADDTSASLPLNRMDKPTRIFVHHYSDFWFLHTQSFDPEPNRYIHCVKTKETCAPRPLLSEVARRWTGPRVEIPSALDHSEKQTGGQTTDSGPNKSNGDDGESIESTRIIDGVEDTKVEVGERPKLELKQRTLPLELPPPTKQEETYDLTAELERARIRDEEKAKKAREKEEARRRALEAAFASESEESESEWEEQEPAYRNDDDEESATDSN